MTLSDLVALAQVTLGDPDGLVWPSSTVEIWCVEALRDYSSHFRRTVIGDEEEAEPGQHEYELPVGAGEVLSVEYPVGQNPPVYLTRLSVHDERFWVGDGWYDVVPSLDATVGPTLVLSAEVKEGDKFRVTYSSLYLEADEEGLEGDATVTVPDHHVPLLLLFVNWKALAERVNKEAVSPARETMYLGQLRITAEVARRQYQDAIGLAKKSIAESAITRRWKMPGVDRIY